MAVNSPTASADGVTVYWRPGCPFCAALRRRLRKLGVCTTEVNIWADPAAAATVRGLAGGNETVPTVVVAGTAMVNPTGGAVLEAARRLAPAAVDPVRVRFQPRRAYPKALVAAWLIVVVAVIASFAVDRAGHRGLGWGFDAVAVAAYLSVRFIRRRGAQVAQAPVPSEVHDS